MCVIVMNSALCGVGMVYIMHGNSVERDLVWFGMVWFGKRDVILV